MKTYDKWTVTTVNVAYNCHVCGRIIEPHTRCFGHDVFRAHWSCAINMAQTQEAERAQRRQPAYVGDGHPEVRRASAYEPEPFESEE